MGRSRWTNGGSRSSGNKGGTRRVYKERLQNVGAMNKLNLN